MSKGKMRVEQEDSQEEFKEVKSDIKKVVGHLRHKECYLGMSGDNIVFAFIPDSEVFSAKDLGKLGQLALEKGLSLEKATTLSASELFERQLRAKELFDDQE